jgi:two-component system, OmpR family, sensor histidine kinase CiaH
MQNLFRSTTLRLTLYYTAILVFVSFLFSVIVFQQSSNAIEQSAQRPVRIFDRLSDRSEMQKLRSQYLLERDSLVRESKSEVLGRLLVINIFIYAAGAVASYALAKKTLRPILKAHQSQVRFTADASHELRTPLTALRLETEVSLDNDKMTLKEAREQLKSNLQEAERLSLLTDRLLQLHGVESDKIELQMVNIVPVLEEIVSRTNRQSDHAQKLVLESPPTVIARTDEKILEHIVSIFVDNAIQHAPKGTEVRIKVLASRMVGIAVIDEGEGIRVEDQKHIFDRFYRSERARTRGDSTSFGLGLSIAKSLAERIDGKLTLDSKLGKGTTFFVTIPSGRSLVGLPLS